MDSKAFILSKIRRFSIDSGELPAIAEFNPTSKDIVGEFKRSLEANHVEVLISNNAMARKRALDKVLEKYQNVMSDLKEVETTVSIKEITPLELNTVQACVMTSTLGVAENGAIWITERDDQLRVLPFIVEHLVVLINERKLVGNMHQAYKIADGRQGFSVFIAGPSKTADIEQVLVIGAHGPKKMTVIIENYE